MEGLESFMAIWRSVIIDEDAEDGKRYAVTPDGRRYLTSRPGSTSHDHTR
jgi:hypothetical protein